MKDIVYKHFFAYCRIHMEAGIGLPKEVHNLYRWKDTEVVEST